MKILCINERREFLSIKLGIFDKKKSIALKYVAFYIHKKNGLAKKR